MCLSCESLASNRCDVCGTRHGASAPNAAPPAVTGVPVVAANTLQGMPNVIMRELIFLNPESVLILRIVSRALNRAGREFLEWNTGRIVTQCLTSDSPLSRVLCRNFIRFALQAMPGIAQFQLSIPRIIRSFEDREYQLQACPDRILFPWQIHQYDLEFQNTDLRKLWTRVRLKIREAQPQLVLPTATWEIRIWLHAPQTVLQNVQKLYLFGMHLTGVPMELRMLTGLRELSLSNNRLTSLPVGLFQGLEGLEQLRIGNNQLTSLPAGLFQGLGALQLLYLHDNQLTSLPEGLFQGLGALHLLYLHSNQLTSLPEGLFQGLGDLRTLFINNNLLSSLPSRLFHGLAKLGEVQLSGNSQLSYNGLPTVSAFNRIHEFFNYRCSTPLSGFYQLAALSNSVEAVKEAFSQLGTPLKNALFGRVWVVAGCPNTCDWQWGEHHTFDQMPVFYGALRSYVMDTFERLSPEEKNNVYYHVYRLAKSEGIDKMDSHPKWGEIHAMGNILRLIEAMVNCGFLASG